jgi:hypothetical protein
MVASKDAVASIKRVLGLAEPGPAGDHLRVYISFWWSPKSCTQLSPFKDQI